MKRVKEIWQEKVMEELDNIKKKYGVDILVQPGIYGKIEITVIKFSESYKDRLKNKKILKKLIKEMEKNKYFMLGDFTNLRETAVLSIKNYYSNYFTTIIPLY